MYETQRKGIILAGGKGTRLYPLTKSVSKQLLPIYDKPMIFYPISTLMMADIREILIITTPNDKNIFQSLLGDGRDFGISLEFAIQPEPRGIAEALLIGESFLRDKPSALILGDNLFHGLSLSERLLNVSKQNSGACIFGYSVKDPERYGVIKFDSNEGIEDIVEKPNYFVSNYAITGLYFYDNTASERTKSLKPSKRGELEITDLNKSYLKDDLLSVEIMTEGMTWLDTGTFDSLHEASSYVQIIEHRQGLKIGCPEEIALKKNWIDKNDIERIAFQRGNNSYGKYLLNLSNKS